MLTLKLSSEDLAEQVLLHLPKPAKVQSAAVRALKTLRQHALRRFPAELARRANIPQRVSKRRIWASKPSKASPYLAITVGSRGIPVEYIASLRQLKAGAKAGQRFYKGAFVAPVRHGSTHRVIFMRRSSPNYDPELYPQRRARQVAPGARLPVYRAELAIKTPAEQMMQANEAAMLALFRTRFAEAL